jgi:hypothetical protein
VDKLSPPVLQLDEVYFYYTKDVPIFDKTDISANSESRICIVSRLNLCYRILWHYGLGSCSDSRLLVCNIFSVEIAYGLFGLNLKYVSSVLNVDNSSAIDELQIVNFQTC